MIRPDPNNWEPTIQGWSEDILPFYSRMADEMPVDAYTVEIGVYRGRSVLFFADTMRFLGKGGVTSVMCAVDTWDGSDVASHAPDEAIYQEFIGHAKRMGLIPPLCVHRETSQHAACVTLEAGLDLVFIDAAHTYEGVKNDIALWLPKLKAGGVIAGHDYCGTFPGVIKAVDEAFGSDVRVSGTVWEVRR